MRPIPVLVLMFLLSACGVSSLEPSHARAGITEQSSTSTPIDCHAMCIRVRPQLIRDFSVRPEDIDCEQRQWWAANDCAACSRVLEINYGVRPTSCP